MSKELLPLVITHWFSAPSPCSVSAQRESTILHSPQGSAHTTVSVMLNVSEALPKKIVTKLAFGSRLQDWIKITFTLPPAFSHCVTTVFEK